MAVYLFDTEQEYLDEIADVRGSIKRSMKIGAENENNSGGSLRKMKEVEFNNLIAYFKQLRKEYCNKYGKPIEPILTTPGW